VPFSCQDFRPMWPGVAPRLPALAPNLAPSQLISNANDPTARTKGLPGRQPALRRGPGPTIARVKIRHQTDVRDSRALLGPIPLGRRCRPRAMTLDDELDRVAARSTARACS
jgi:hypothetical protein